MKIKVIKSYPDAVSNRWVWAGEVLNVEDSRGQMIIGKGLAVLLEPSAPQAETPKQEQSHVPKAEKKHIPKAKKK